MNIRIVYPIFCATAIVLALLAGGSDAFSQDPDRSTPPAAGPVRPLRMPILNRAVLDNGIPVICVEKRGVPLVEIRLVLRAGIANDPKDMPGLASMTFSMIAEGAGSRGALELADAIDYLGARISAGAGLHTSTVSLFTSVSKLADALPVYADVALRPLFPIAELDRLRAERLTGMMQWKDQPRTVASLYFNTRLFGNKHPYGRPSVGTAKALKEMKPEHLRAFHAAHMLAGNATLIVVGDVNQQRILSMLNASFGSLAKGASDPPALPEVKQVTSRRIVIVHKPGAAQSEIRIGRIGAARSSKDYFALVVMNTLLGGSFSSRLNQNLREQHGYTYGARSSFAFRQQAGPFLAAAAVQTAVTDKALAEFFNELNAIRETATDEEISRARNYVAYSYPQNFEAVSDIAGELEELVEHALPFENLSSFVPGILAVTKADVLRVAKSYIDTGALDIVIVGDRKEIEYGVRSLKLGDVKIMDVDDALEGIER